MYTLSLCCRCVLYVEICIGVNLRRKSQIMRFVDKSLLVTVLVCT